MKLRDYLYDKKILIILSFLTLLIIIILLKAFNINNLLIVFVIIFLIISYLIPFFYDYYKRKIFFNLFKKSIDNIDKKYLITEIINNSNFIEGKLLLDYIYEINKYMHEEINNYKYINEEFREYIELWCHEIKTPIATSKLIIENNYNKVTKNVLEEIDNIEYFVEQVLFYSRSDNLEKDFIISEVKTKKVIDNVILKNKKVLINKKIKIIINEIEDVKSDAKWLEFIINQIVINSIKYARKNQATIEFKCTKNKNNVTLIIKDNGIGINENDLEHVFDKGFTGNNGRKKSNSTGIGLYLCKKMCLKMDHKILIESKENDYTMIKIIFPNSSLVNLTEM